MSVIFKFKVKKTINSTPKKMLKHKENFVEPTDNFKDPLKRVFDISSKIPEKKSYHVTQDFEGNFINGQPRVCSKKCIKLSPSKNKQNQKKKSSVFIKLATISRPNILHSYLSYSEILQYLDYIKLRFVDFVQIHTLGTTFERRAIKCIEINWNSEKNHWSHAKENRARSAPIHYTKLKQIDDLGSANSGRNIVFIEGGTHAREWISVAVALNCIHQLTEKNVRHRDLLRKLKFYIVPVVNPDGYEYSRNVNPRWRKNRRPYIHGDYVGTDCNRNFDFHWDTSLSKAKRNTYQGDKPFSEHETKALATILHSLAPKLLFFLSLHSYAQSIMYPWGYSKLLPKNSKLMESVAIAGRNAIKALSGRYYRVGSIARITKRNIGGSVVDYAYGAVKIPLTLVMELPSSEYGFQPPADKIHPLGMESWHGIREMCKKAYSLKAQIEQEEITESLEKDETKGENLILANDLNFCKEKEQEKALTINCDPQHLSYKSHEFRTIRYKMSEGVITSMLDVTF